MCLIMRCCHPYLKLCLIKELKRTSRIFDTLARVISPRCFMGNIFKCFKKDFLHSSSRTRTLHKGKKNVKFFFFSFFFLFCYLFAENLRSA